MRTDPAKRLTILSDAEKRALYGRPDFDEFQRAEYFALTEAELHLVQARQGTMEQVYCLLQLGYFKAKQAFFRFTGSEVPPEDLAFILSRYFPGVVLNLHPIRENEVYAQRGAITDYFGFRLWAAADQAPWVGKVSLWARRDVTATFLLAELVASLNAEKIVRPGYTTLQTIIAEALAVERRRLEQAVEAALDDTTQKALDQLIVREGTLSALAAIKQDAKDFGYRMMVAERQKRATLEPLYRCAKAFLPTLELSQQNLSYYASLAHYYTVYDLRRLKPGQTYLYLLCYAWQRYRQLTDNLVDALLYHLKRIEDDTRAKVQQELFQSETKQSLDAPQVGRLLLLYVDDRFDDATPFGQVREQAFAILSRTVLNLTGQRLCSQPTRLMELRWQAVDSHAGRFKRNLRPLFVTLELTSTIAESPWWVALAWMKQVFSRQQALATQPLSECPDGTIPKRLRPYLWTFDANGKATGLRGDRYEFWIYRQIRKRFQVGELYLDDSLRHRRLNDELVPPERQREVIEQLDLAWLREPVDTTLDRLFDELRNLWRTFDRDLRRGQLKHLDYDSNRKTLTWRRPKADPESDAQAGFFAKLPTRSIADIFRFVNEHCQFLTALTPLQPRYAKKIADPDSLMAVILAQAMNHGNPSMAETSDVPYHVLEATHQQYLRLATLRAANDRISNAIAGLSIFPHYSFDLEILYGSVDGQKFEVASPTVKARYSRKYFGKGKGVVAYTLLANHVPLHSTVIGAHEHESHYVFDVCYHNTSNILPTAITGDMHSINKANFAILYWFGWKLEPHFTNPEAQLKHLYAGHDPTECERYLIPPVGQIDRSLIAAEKAHLDQIVATLALKEMTQSTLIRKPCTYSGHHRTRRALFEFDRLIRSLYTLRYLRDPQLQRHVHRSQNRLEAYHQLRAALAQMGGRKQLIGRTDLDVAISNECGRLLANVVIAYNSILLSALLDRYQAAGHLKAIDLLKHISPVAWQHIHFLGQYTFRSHAHPIDLETLLAGVNLV